MSTANGLCILHGDRSQDFPRTTTYTYGGKRSIISSPLSYNLQSQQYAQVITNTIIHSHTRSGILSKHVVLQKRKEKTRKSTKPLNNRPSGPLPLPLLTTREGREEENIPQTHSTHSTHTHDHTTYPGPLLPHSSTGVTSTSSPRRK